MKVRINPELLKWARQEAGYSVEAVSSYLHTDPKEYAKWEETGVGVPWGRLLELARKFKRQAAAFFLPVAPPLTKKPNDFRNLRLIGDGISPETLLAVRRARKFLDIAGHQFGKGYWDKRYEWTSRIPTAAMMREIVEISVQEQQSFKSASHAFSNWRASFENKLGIFTFQFALPFEEIQAFCIADKQPFAIVLNSRHSYTGRIFSLFHELSHIMSGQSGLCYHDNIEKSQSTEYSCNEFAGKFLVPDDVVPRISGLDDLHKYAKIFNVSAEVILRRNLERSLVSQSNFFKLLAELRKILPPRRRGGAVSQVDKARATRGNMFFNLVVDAVRQGNLDFNTASDALGLKANYLMYA